MISTDPEPVERPKSQNQDDLKIAFRYKNLSAKESSQQHQFGHYYDLSKKMSEEELKSADIGYWTCSNILSNGKCSVRKRLGITVFIQTIFLTY